MYGRFVRSPSELQAGDMICGNSPSLLLSNDTGCSWASTDSEQSASHIGTSELVPSGPQYMARTHSPNP